MGEKGFGFCFGGFVFGLNSDIIAHNQRKSGQQLKQGRNSAEGSDAEAMEEQMLTSLLFMACSTYFLIKPKTQGWHHLEWATSLPIARSYGSIFSTERDFLLSDETNLCLIGIKIASAVKTLSQKIR